MATKIGSLLIEVASGVARVESDMQKITKVINSNAEQWTKAFQLVKIAGASWLAKEVFREGIQLMGEFAAAGLEGASKLKEHAAAAAEFKQRQAELNTELQKFAGQFIGPILPQLNDFMLAFRGLTGEVNKFMFAFNVAQGLTRDVARWASAISPTAMAWTKAADAAKEYADGVRAADKAEKERAERKVRGALFSDKELEEEYNAADNRRVGAVRNLMNLMGKIERERPEQVRKALEEQRRAQLEYDRIFAEDARIARTVRDEQEREWDRQGEARAIAKRELDAQISFVYNQNRADTLQGQLELLEEHYRSELALTNWNAQQKLAIEKRYTTQANNIAVQRKALAMSTSASMYGALGQAAGAFFGEQHAIVKAFGIAEAIVNMNRAVMLALATYPPPLGAKMAAVARIQGMAAIASIVASSFTGGGGSGAGGGGAVAGGGPSIQSAIPEPSAPTMDADGEKQRETGKTTIIIQNMIGERSWVTNNLVPLLEESQRDRGWNVEVRQ